MPKGVLVVQTEAASPERTEEYHKWYDEVHVPQLCEVPGVKSARRFDLVGDNPSVAKHLAIYELEGDDVAVIYKEMMGRVRDGSVDVSDCIRVDPPPVMLLYEQRD